MRLADSQGQLLLPLVCQLAEQHGIDLTDIHDEKFIEWLHEWLLKVSARRLTDARVGKAEREDCLQWLMRNDNGPFSFIACCRMEGADPETVRESVLYRMRRKEKTNAPTKQDASATALLPGSQQSLSTSVRHSVR
jgi:hypothetical protein